MKRLFYLCISALLLTYCSKGVNKEIVKVEFPENTKELISWGDRFGDKEVIPLTGDSIPQFGFFCNILINNGDYYIIDPMQTQKVHRFNKDGKYLNSIGTNGRGPNEYLNITDVMFDDQGNLLIYSQASKGLYKHKTDGTFLSKEELPYNTERFITDKGLNYYYIGTSGLETPLDYKLYVTNQKGETISEQIPSVKAPTFPNAQTLIANNGNIYLCPTEGNDIYVMENGNANVKYSFDFGEYNIPEEYYQSPNLFSIGEFLKGKKIVFKNAFSENDDCAILEGIVQTGIFEAFDLFYGIYDKKNKTWRWEWTDFTKSPMLYRYMDKDNAYFIADMEALNENPDMSAKFPQIGAVDNGNGMAIIKAKTKSIK